MEVLQSPINRSLIAGGMSFIISMIFLKSTKAEIIMTTDDNNEEVIDNFKLYIFCVMIGVAVAVCVFLVMCKGGGNFVEYNAIGDNETGHKKTYKKNSKSY
jgi:hypothetical protein